MKILAAQRCSTLHGQRGLKVGVLMWGTISGALENSEKYRPAHYHPELRLDVGAAHSLRSGCNCSVTETTRGYVYTEISICVNM